MNETQAPLIGPDSPHSDHKDYSLPGGVLIKFQKGAMELGRNGCTTEELLCVLQEHIEGFQRGAFACEENAAVIMHLNIARAIVLARAERRKAQGVKGREAAHEGPKPAGEEPMLQFFKYEHLPVSLQEISRPFFFQAQDIVLALPRNPERTVALRKLLESKDCAVRALIYRGA